MTQLIKVAILTNLPLEEHHKSVNRFIEHLQHACNQVTKHSVKLALGADEKADFVVLLAGPGDPTHNNFDKDLGTLSRRVKELPAGQEKHVFKLIIPPVQVDWPDSLKQTVETHLDSDAFSKVSGKEYWTRNMDVAYWMHALIFRRDDKVRPQIFLAEVPDDMLQWKEELRRDLMDQNFRVEPSFSLQNDPKPEEAMHHILLSSQYSIHMMGRYYGDEYDETGLSFSEWQSVYVTRFIQDHPSGDLNRLYWIPQELEDIEPRQEQFMQYLRQEIENLPRTEIIQSPLELFKTLIIKRISRHDPLEETAGKSGQRTLFLIYDPLNSGRIDKIKSVLEHKNLHLIDQEWLEEHMGKKMFYYWNVLSSCDGVVIHQGSSGKEWVDSKLKDLRKAPGFGRKKPLKAIATLDPDTMEQIPGNVFPDFLETLSQESEKSFEALKEFTKKILA